MYCPKCSQQQAADDVRFCARCGFPLGGVRELIAGSGLAPSAGPHAPALSPRQRGIRQGARLTFLSVVLFPLFYGICFVVGSPLPLTVSGTLFLGGLAWMIYARLFGESFLPALARVADARLGGRASGDLSLHAAPRAPAAALGPRHANTAEMPHPASVVDHTTNLLDRT
jgi:hypothetical protein